MSDLLHQSTHYYRTYEEREEAFRKSAFSLIPRKHLGPGPFWKDLRHISKDGFSKISTAPVAFVTSNPRDCLAFGTPIQVLTAACLSAGSTEQRLSSTVENIAEAFGVSGNMHQPVRTLSGGETVKLALAKSYASAAATTRLAIASPFCWLSRDNAGYFKKLFQHYKRLDLPLEVFALEGEDSDLPINADDLPGINVLNPVDFTLRLKDVELNLGTSFNTLYSHQTFVRVDDFSAQLSSPCLLVGENGQGKSLVARILTGAISHRGDARIVKGGSSGGPRLLFQDVITQTLLRSFDAIADSSGGGRRCALALYEEILDYFSQFSEKNAGGRGDAANAPAESSPSLLEIKAILVAVRLSIEPGALILDEPDWGMNRTDAVAFVTAIIRAAHLRGVPVMIISHKPWWLTIAGSKIHVKRTQTIRNSERESEFFIRIGQHAEGVE